MWFYLLELDFPYMPDNHPELNLQYFYIDVAIVDSSDSVQGVA